MPRGREDSEDEEETQRESRTQRRNRRATQGTESDYGNGDGGGSTQGSEDQAELVKRCIRYLISRNSKGRPVRRPELSKYVMDGHSRTGKSKAFNSVLAQAEEELQTVFSMRLTPVCKKVQPSASMSMTARTQRTQTQGGADYNVSKAYVLETTLPSDNRPVNREDSCKRGFITTIAALIALTPEVKIEQDDLYRSLERMGAPVREVGGHEQINGGNTKDFIEKTLVEQWYLEKEKDPADPNTLYLRIGARLWAELTVAHLISFIEVVYNSSSEKDDDNNNRTHDSSIGLDDAARKELRHKLEAESNFALGIDDDDDD